MKSLSIIVAMTEQRVIGKNSRLPWKIPEDMDLFKQTTLHNTVVMGRNTWFSLPAKSRPLPERKNIVISKSTPIIAGAEVCYTLQDAVEKAERYEGNIFVIGGGELYKSALPLADKLYISHIKKHYDGNVFFPEIKFDEWNVKEEREYSQFIFKRYDKK